MDTFNLPYRYAQRSRGETRDYIFFSAYDPTHGTMRRKRIYIDHIREEKTRDRHAKKLIDHINNLLDAGKNPFIDQENNKKYTTIDKSLTFVIEFKNLYIRKRTQHAFDSRMKVLREWLSKRGFIQKYIFEFTEDVAITFMNDLIHHRKITGRTFNNYLLDYRTFFNTLVKNKFIVTNPFHAVSKIPEQETDKRPFRDEEATRYFQYIKESDFHFYIISLYCYYLALRPAEICRLKISDFWLDKGVVIVPGSKSKNKKKRIVPIAIPFLKLLKDYFKNLPSGFYICSKGFKPGTEFEHSTRIAEHFRKIATPLNIPREVKFYCLKDTAADRLLEAGFTTKTIRDLFGHSSIAATDAYLKKFRNTIDVHLIENFPVPY
jgi:integrase/recombinase XerD